MLKRYIVFVWMQHEALGGWQTVLRDSDKVLSFDEQTEAKERLESEGGVGHVVDLHTGEIVITQGNQWH